MTLEALEVVFTADAGALSSSLGALRGKVDALAASVRAAFSGLYQNGLSAGQALGDGLALGLQSKLASVSAAARRLARAAGGSVREELAVHSPSRVSQRLGERFGEGLALGMLSMQGLVENAGRSLSSAALSMERSLPAQASSLPESAAQTLREGDLESALTRAVSALAGERGDIVLTVDGMTLGRAAARGINALRKTTGALPLEI